MSQFEWVKPMFGSDFRDPSINAIETFLASKASASNAGTSASIETSLPTSAEVGDSLTSTGRQGNPASPVKLSSLSPEGTSSSPSSSPNHGPSSESPTVTANGTASTSRGKRKSLEEKDSAIQSAAKHTKGASEPSDETMDADSPEAKGKTSDRRKEQNRNAQRAFRERKEKRLHELEDQVATLEATQQSSETENANLRDLVARLQSENQRLSVYEQAFTFTMTAIGRSNESQPGANKNSDESPSSQDSLSVHQNSPKQSTASLSGSRPFSSLDGTGSGADLPKPQSSSDPFSSTTNGSQKNASYGSAWSSGATSTSASTPSDGNGSNSKSGASTSPTASLPGLTPPTMTSGINPSALFVASPASMSFGDTSSSAPSMSPLAFGVPTPPSATQLKDDETSIFNGLTFLNEKDWDPSMMTFLADPNDSAGLGTFPGLTPGFELSDFWSATKPGAAVTTNSNTNNSALDIGWNWPTISMPTPKSIDADNNTSTRSPKGFSPPPSTGLDFSHWRDQALRMDPASGALFQAPSHDDSDSIFAGLLSSSSPSSSHSLSSIANASTRRTAQQVAPQVLGGGGGLDEEVQLPSTPTLSSSTSASTGSMLAKPCMAGFVESGVLSAEELDDLCLSMSTKATCSEKAEMLREIKQKHPKLEPMISQWQSAAKMAADAGGTPFTML